MHARTEPERICIQHRIIRVETMMARSKGSSSSVGHIRSRWWWLALQAHGDIMEAKIWNELICHGVISGSVIDDFCMGLELLICAHPISQGRAESNKRRMTGREGELAGQMHQNAAASKRCTNSPTEQNVDCRCVGGLTRYWTRWVG